MSDEAKLIRVAEVFVVQHEGQYVGVEVGFTDSVLSKQGAATCLDFMRGALNSSFWITNTVMRVEDRDAQTELGEEGDGGEDSETPPEPDVSEADGDG